MKNFNKNIEIGEKIETIKIVMKMTNLIKFLPLFDKIRNFSILCSKKSSKTEISILKKRAFWKAEKISFQMMFLSIISKYQNWTIYCNNL